MPRPGTGGRRFIETGLSLVKSWQDSSLVVSLSHYPTSVPPPFPVDSGQLPACGDGWAARILRLGSPLAPDYKRLQSLRSPRGFEGSLGTRCMLELLVGGRVGAWVVIFASDVLFLDCTIHRFLSVMSSCSSRYVFLSILSSYRSRPVFLSICPATLSATNLMRMHACLHPRLPLPCGFGMSKDISALRGILFLYHLGTEL